MDPKGFLGYKGRKWQCVLSALILRSPYSVWCVGSISVMREDLKDVKEASGEASK